MIAKQMQAFGENRSVIREIFEYSSRRKKEIGSQNVFDFSLGNPSVPAPPEVTEALLHLLTSTPPQILHGYTSAAGDSGVREALASYLNQVHGAHLTKDFLYLTVGAAASLTVALHALCNPGDEVLVFSPYFPEYKVFIEKAGAKTVEVPLSKPSFLPDFSTVESYITPKTKAVIVNSPNNPTGAVWDEKTLLTLAKMLDKCQGAFGNPIYLLADEPYRELVFDGTVPPFLPNLYKNTLVCYSFSKSLSLPGERIGYLLVNPAAEDAEAVFSAVMGAGRALGFVCAPAIFQFLIPYCLGKTADLSVYRKNGQTLYQNLTSFGYECVPPQGAFYLFVKSPIPDANAFCEAAKRYELLLVPSDSFGCPGYLRIAYCTDADQITRSLPAFQALAKEFGLRKA